MSALPRWHLLDLYPGTHSPRVTRDLKALAAECKAFRKTYEGKVEKLSAEGLAKAIKAYEAIEDRLGKLASYAQLVFASEMNDPKATQFYQNIQERVTTIGLDVLFFTLALNRIDEKSLQQKLKHKALQHYAPWLRDVRAYRPYQLSDEIEKLLMEKQVTGHTAWMRLFDETLDRLRFDMDGKKLTAADTLDLLSHKDGRKRRKASEALGKVFEQNVQTFALVTNTLAKDKQMEDDWRKFKKPISSRNLDNLVEDKVVDALITTVKKNYVPLAHRYYRIKAGWLKQKKLNDWDRNAPLPGARDKTWKWEEAKELVLSSYRHFSPAMAKVGEQFFTKRWIDAAPRPGKDSGAFSHPTVPSAHPYILMNFQGKVRDVMTLAHELGHGVHQVLSAKQGALMADTPLTLAETASVFGEQLTFQEILRREKNPTRRKHMIAGKVEDMLNTVVRQIAFCEFETRVHDARKKGELTAEQISDIWLDVQKESLGPVFNFSKHYRYFWVYISHFIHAPFYVYAYAFGDCLVNSLYGVYEKEKSRGRGREFEKKYLAMLSAGGTLRHKELLAPFGLDASKPAFWQEGLNVISGLIDELEK